MLDMSILFPHAKSVVCTAHIPVITGGIQKWNADVNSIGMQPVGVQIVVERNTHGTETRKDFSGLFRRGPKSFKIDQI